MLLLLRLVVQYYAHAAKLLRREPFVGYEVGEQELDGALEQLARQVGQGTFLRRVLLDGREITLDPPLFLVPHITLGFQHPQDCEHCRISELVRQTPAHIGYDRRTMVPEDLHDIGLAIGQDNGHGGSIYYDCSRWYAPCAEAVNYINSR